MTDDQITQSEDTESTDGSQEQFEDSAAPEPDLTRVRELVLAAHPDVVPELVQGGTFDELMASVEPAREAYQRIISETAQSRTAPKVAAQPGQRSTSIVDMESLSPLGKISEGLRRSS